jgi:hypothetical protein
MIGRMLTRTAAVLLPITASYAQSGLPDRCDNQRPLPFASIEVTHPLDKTCGINGKTTSSANSQLQNSVKNNFCAINQNLLPETYTPAMLADLQRQTTIPSGQGHEPADRQPLKQLGEGKVIRMKAYLIEAHHADLGSGESVNCGDKTEEGNDVHIAFGSAADTQECDSVTAEISPHYRPASWNEIGHYETYNNATRKYTVDPQMAARLQAHPYRVTGQLFFDASHTACPCGKNCAPVRVSVWEIHPVYAIEVCRAGTACQESNDGDWLSFDSWWKSLTPVQPTPPPHRHVPHETVTAPTTKRHRSTKTGGGQ